MELKPDCTFDEFEKLDIRLGTIIDCKKQENSERLLVFQIYFGEFQRQIVSSIAMYYKPEDLIGKQVCAIVNFKARVIRGVESHGMLLCAENEEDTMLSLVTTMEKINNGLFIG